MHACCAHVQRLEAPCAVWRRSFVTVPLQEAMFVDVPAHNPLLGVAAAAHLGTMSDIFVMRQELPLSRLLKSSANACIQSAAQQQYACSRLRLLHSHRLQFWQALEMKSAQCLLKKMAGHTNGPAQRSLQLNRRRVKHVHTLLPTRGAP